MTTKPETLFYQRIHRALGSNPPFFQKMYTPLSAGTPDMYYSGQKGELWIEYKFDPRAGLGVRFVKPELSSRQTAWLNGRCREGRNVAVLLGGPSGRVVIYENERWSVPMAPSFWKDQSVSEREAAQWILSKTGHRYEHHQPHPVPNSTD